MSEKRSKKKISITIAVVAVVIVAAGAGFAVWHSQPSFCNAICHSPMDSHVEQYYGNDESVLVTPHAQAEIVCVDCHNPNLGEQLAEASAWISGNFSDPMQSRSEKLATKEFCYGCHNDGDSSNGKDWEEIVSSTADYEGNVGMNPHESHMTELQCGDCHKIHSASTFKCAECHNIGAPESWE